MIFVRNLFYYEEIPSITDIRKRGKFTDIVVNDKETKPHAKQ